MRILATILLVLVLLFVVWLLLLRCRSRGRGWKKLLGRRYAHRGWHDKPAIPENSLPAFRRALDRGWGAELDVHLLRDGTLAVFHDSDLRRCTGEAGNIEDLDREGLSRLRLEGTEEPVPLFDEVLALFEGKAPLIIELKSHEGNYKALTEAVIARLDRYRGDFCVESFDPRALAWFKRHAPAVVRGQLSTNMRDAKLNPVTKFLLQNLLMNFLGRPQFIAYEQEFIQNMPFRHCVTWFGAIPCAWTVTDQNTFDNLSKSISMIIFEKFFPRTKYDHTVKFVRGRAVRPD